MNTVELFSGTKSFSKIAQEYGYTTFTIDNNAAFKPDVIYDLSLPLIDSLWKQIENADIIWMSPPCQTFSMAAGNTHWTAERTPKTYKAVKALRLLRVCEYIARYCLKEGKYFVIENPRARARWFLPVHWRTTVWYCQYGDNRAKPTDIWTNIPFSAKTCKNNNPFCNHERAPRGSRTGTQGIKGHAARSQVPPKLIRELLENIQ